jgi:uncharacterized 2Fe-2S/4Fe-4S cluster protein (DUF4445 family)
MFYMRRIARRPPDVVITQTDVRQIQLAKAALYAGIKLLMDEMGVTSVDRIRLAGAFGQPYQRQPRYGAGPHPRL